MRHGHVLRGQGQSTLKPGRRRERRRRLAHVEHLEARTLLSSSLNSGLLTVTGDNGNDAISLAVSGVTLNVVVNGNATPYPLGMVSQILINTGAGNNSVTMGSGVIGATVNAGAGNDTFTAGTGNDSFVGGAGNDLLIAGSGHDVLAWRFGQRHAGRRLGQ